MDAALRQLRGGRGFTTDVDRVLRALVANRAVDPCSKLAAAEWATHDAAIPGLTAIDEDHAYRATDRGRRSGAGGGVAFGRPVPGATSDPDLSAEDVALGDKNLLEAERGFRDLKSTWTCDPSSTASGPASARTCCSHTPPGSDARG